MSSTSRKASSIFVDSAHVNVKLSMAIVIQYKLYLLLDTQTCKQTDYIATITDTWTGKADKFCIYHQTARTRPGMELALDLMSWLCHRGTEHSCLCLRPANVEDEDEEQGGLNSATTSEVLKYSLS